ncbi:DUF481 domain-containing protein [Hugenholtzia roseola]|uniref:DUF481 domain-containing protein n=1 Tax=Hugenholtzia roseola TaxID=1002 RepID=UPI0004119047|nr:DUF481 domain-containing protein [Hugenholtzia roseola]
MKNLLFIFLLFPLSLFAQINESDTAKIKGNLALTGFWQGGNVETLVLRAKMDLSLKPLKVLVFKTQNAYLYQEFFKQKADEDIFSRNFLYFKPENKIYPFLLGFISTNFRRKIDLRYFVGAGATWQIVRKKNHLLKTALSAEYEDTKFAQNNFNENQYDGSTHLRTWRATAWIFGKHHLANDKIILSYESYIQPSIEEANNFRWQAEASADFPLSKHVSFRMSYLYTFEKIVIENQRQQDRILTFGLNLKI